MPIWPFKKRRRRSIKDEAKEPLTEKAQPPRAVTSPTAGPTTPVPIPHTSSKRDSQLDRHPSQEDTNTAAGTQLAESEKRPESSEKENVRPAISRQRSSREDITALPMSRKLQSSPHLRPVDVKPPPIPYNFRPYSDSQTSVQRDQGVGSPTRQPNKLRSRRSGYDSAGPPSRRQSNKRRKDDHLREEEIRAMSAQMPVSKRPGGFGEGPLRRDSKKMRSLGTKESNVSIPPEESIHSTMSGVVEQRGWEIGSMDVFNPRPAVRLSGVPQYVTPGSLPTSSPPPTSPEPLKKEKEKMPVTRDSEKKRETIGTRADELDASDIRLLMERDAKRREKKKKEQQEKLDRKLRNRGGRNRGDSDRKKREAEEARRAEEAKQRAEYERRERELTTPPSAVHPALRDAQAEEKPEPVGLGIGEGQAEPGAAEPEDPFQDAAESSEAQPEDPFRDDAMEQEETPVPEQLPTMPGAFTPVQTPMEEPVIETAREMSISQAATPPLSPVQSARATSSLSQMMDARRASDLQPPPPITDQRRASDPKHERRAGAWATFFRRGGTKLQRPGDARSPPSEASFSNTSRESMRNQPLPPHLVDTQVPRRKSGTPVRTQSKFREDLPEMPISPPDSRLPSPDVTTAAAAAAATRRAGRSSAPVAVPEDAVMDETAESDPQSAVRSDTPITPSAPTHRITSMGSVGSEGSWFASGSAKRQSTQSNLNQRTAEFSASYEELGGDRDAEYVGRMASSPRGMQARKISSPMLSGDDPEEESEEDEPSTAGQAEIPSDPLTVHESVRRQPTLVHRDPRVKSREGLLAEYEGDIPAPTSAGTGKGSMLDFDPDEPEPQMQRAHSIEYGKGHTRQISAGSVKLLDVPPTPRRPSGDVPSLPTSPTSPTSSSQQ